MSGFALHPDAFTDLDQIWEFIAADNIAAADRVIGDVFETLRSLAASRHIGHRRQDLTSKPLRFIRVRDTSSPTHPMRTRCGCSRSFTAAEIHV